MLKQKNLLKHISQMTNFEKKVLLAVLEIPRGRISTYKRIAEKIGRPKAYRAVGNTLHKNPLAPIIPCHRVVRSNGEIVGETKDEIENRKKMLKEEGVPIIGNKVKLTDEIIY